MQCISTEDTFHFAPKLRSIVLEKVCTYVFWALGFQIICFIIPCTSISIYAVNI